MSNSENKHEGKGFAGLQALRSRDTPPAKNDEDQGKASPTPELPSAWQDQASGETRQQPTIEQSSTGPNWGSWIALGIVFLIFGIVVVASIESDTPSSSYAQSTTPAAADTAYIPPQAPFTSSSSEVSVASVGLMQLGNAVGYDNKIVSPTSEFAPSDVIHLSVETDGPGATLSVKWTYQNGQTVDSQDQLVAAGAQTTDFSVSKPDGWPLGDYKVAISMDGSMVGDARFTVARAREELPPAGMGLVLSDPQIRYCVYENRRLKGGREALDSYNQGFVDKFNARVSDYNMRCSNYQYREGALAPIEREADQIEYQLEQEGKSQFSDGLSAETSAAISAAAAAQAADEAIARATDASEQAANAAIASKLSRDNPFESANSPNESAGEKTFPTSFDCANAGSIPEYLICHDSELADQDRQLASIYASARQAVSDKDALTERARRQWNYREKNCRDKPCLLAWFSYQKAVMSKIALSGDVNAN